MNRSHIVFIPGIQNEARSINNHFIERGTWKQAIWKWITKKKKKICFFAIYSPFTSINSMSIDNCDKVEESFYECQAFSG